MKQRIYSLLFALLAIVTGAKAATTKIELYDGLDCTSNSRIQKTVEALVTAKILDKPEQLGNTALIFSRKGKRLFAAELDKAKEFTIIHVPTEVIPSVDRIDEPIGGNKYIVEFSVVINPTNFTDKNFRSYVAKFDTEKSTSGRLTRSELEAEGAKKIDVYDKNIASLKGVEYFAKLETLNCNNNQLTTLDMSKNTALTDLLCFSNQLTSLDVSKNTALTDLNCRNNLLTTLDVSKNTALTQLVCHSNQLTSLDVSSCTALTDLNCRNNLLTTLDVSKNTALTQLVCHSNQLTSLDVSGCTAMVYLYCAYNPLTTLDVSGCTALTSLLCFDNQLTSLNVTGCTALAQLSCDINQLTSLNVSGCTALTSLTCYRNLLTTLDVSGFTALKTLLCDHNQLTSLNVTGCTALTRLDCYQNRIRGAGMAALVSSLPGDRSDAYMHVYSTYDSPEDNAITRIQAQIVREEKGWKLMKIDEAADNWVEYFGEAVRGDVNGDGELTAADIETISDYILGQLPDDQPIDEESADLNEDHEINIEDVTLLIDMIVENDDQPDEQVYKQCPNDHHPHIIDLGLPSGTLWSCCNIGADAPSAYGTYYKWSESVAEDAWGAKWATPTIDQLHELLEKTPSVWTTKDGINGRLFTAENGAKLFLPAGGMNPGYEGDGVGEYIYYRSSTKKEEGSYINLGIYSDKNTVVGDWNYIHTITMPVRPVRK